MRFPAAAGAGNGCAPSTAPLSAPLSSLNRQWGPVVIVGPGRRQWEVAGVVALLEGDNAVSGGIIGGCCGRQLLRMTSVSSWIDGASPDSSLTKHLSLCEGRGAGYDADCDGRTDEDKGWARRWLEAKKRRGGSSSVFGHYIFGYGHRILDNSFHFLL